MRTTRARPTGLFPVAAPQGGVASSSSNFGTLFWLLRKRIWSRGWGGGGGTCPESGAGRDVEESPAPSPPSPRPLPPPPRGFYKLGPRAYQESENLSRP